MVARPPKKGQYEPKTATSGKDCVAAGAAYLVWRATVGRIHTDHARIRAASGAPSTRGLYLSEGAAAAERLYGVHLTVGIRLSRNTVRDGVAGGAAHGIVILGSVTVNTDRATFGNVKPHLVYLNAYNWWPKGEVCDCEKRTAAGHAEFTVEDPGNTSIGYQQWSADLVYKAAEAINGGQGMNTLIAPDTEGVKRPAIAAGYLRVSPSTSAQSGGRLKVGRIYAVAHTLNGPGGEGWHRLASRLYARGAHLA